MRFKFPTTLTKRRVAATSVIVIVLALLLGVGYWLWLERSKKNKDLEATRLKALEEARALSIKAEPAELEVYVTAQGVADFHPKHALRIHPAFSGVVTRVTKELGDSVQAGELLASIESNVGIQVFQVTSPIKGTVLGKSISQGQFVTSEEEILSVGDASVLQARLSVPARAAKQVQRGQAVSIMAEGDRFTRSSIGFISPILSEDTRTATAIIDFSSAEFLPGMFVTGAIVVATRPVAVTLPLGFCETKNKNINSVTVIGAKDFETRTIRFGARDLQRCEVLAGLSAGEEVVDLTEPEEQEHEHEHEHEHK